MKKTFTINLPLARFFQKWGVLLWIAAMILIALSVHWNEIVGVVRSISGSIVIMVRDSQSHGVEKNVLYAAIILFCTGVLLMVWRILKDQELYETGEMKRLSEQSKLN